MNLRRQECVNQNVTYKPFSTLLTLDTTAAMYHIHHPSLRLQPIILGDLNADCSHANRDKRMAANDYLTTSTNTYTWLIDDHADTTSRTSTNCSYDRWEEDGRREEEVE